MEFPVAGVEGLETSLVLTNEASLEVNYVVELFDDEGTFMAPLSGTIDGPGQVSVELDELPMSAFGIRVTGTARSARRWWVDPTRRSPPPPVLPSTTRRGCFSDLGRFQPTLGSVS